MENLDLALRNIGRNRRRSIVTIAAIAISCGGLALFGGYKSWTFRAGEVQTVSGSGHIQVFRRGYFESGSGNPAAYAIEDYDKLKALIQGDPETAAKLDLVTGQIVFPGMVTSPRTQSSATFIGIGVFPSEDKRLAHWNPYGITPAESIAENAPFFAGLPELDDSDIAGASVGSGLAHILRLDEKPGEALLATAEGSAAAKDDGGVDLGFLASQSGPRDEDAGGKPSLDLLVAPPSGGMPNAASVSLRKIVPGTTKELADRMIKLHAKHASQMLFPNQPLHVTALVVLLKRTEDTQAVLERLKVLFERDKLDLECRPWEEIRPVYPRMKKMVGLIFSFMFVLLTVMVAFLIYNTQAAGIMERLAEVGTLRAMGLTRLSLWRLLVLEGLVLGVIGGVLGIALAIAGDIGFNAANITYIPPSVSFYAKLEVLVLRDPIVLLQSFAGTLLCALASSAIPARRAARMEIVEALRHS